MSFFAAFRGKSKYGNVKTERDGRRFDSQAEARQYDFLKAQQAAGEVTGFLCQVPFWLAPDKRYVADFLVFYSDGTAKVVDVKGMRTKDFETKKAWVEQKYPWIGSIEIVTA